MTKPLINIKSDMRRRINERLYTSNMCLEYLGTPNPKSHQIKQWKITWDTKYSVVIDSRKGARETFKNADIPALLYDIRYLGEDTKVVVFFRDEDLVLFKLMYDNT